VQRLAGLITDSTREAILTKVQKLAEQGMKATEIASALKETFTGWKESRGKLIAITETTLASNTGGLEVFRAAGVKEKQWVTQLDTSVRHTHKNAHGQTKNLDEKFEVGGHAWPTQATRMGRKLRRLIAGAELRRSGERIRSGRKSLPVY
jgi:hypothetical protein